MTAAVRRCATLLTMINYRGRMVAHRYAGRPEMRYRYDDIGRVTEQRNPAGLSYTYQYEKNRIIITDSLNRCEVLHYRRRSRAETGGEKRAR
ncbi:YD repeat-containing protein [Escherichia coli]|nr:YD repeat-containing protein [Escherichia coli]